MEFKANVVWDKQGKLCKMTQKKDKKDRTYFIGQLGKTSMLTLNKIDHAEYGKDKQGNQLWQLYITPIEYEKIQAQDEEGKQEEFNKEL